MDPIQALTVRGRIVSCEACALCCSRAGAGVDGRRDRRRARRSVGLSQRGHAPLARGLDLLLLQPRGRAVEARALALGEVGHLQALPDDRALLAARIVLAALLLGLDLPGAHDAHREEKLATRSPLQRTSASMSTQQPSRRMT